MALTLAESAKLSQDMLQRGVIETIIEESPVLERLPFITVEGNSFKYNQENTLPAASFFAVNVSADKIIACACETVGTMDTDSAGAPMSGATMLPTSMGSCHQRAAHAFTPSVFHDSAYSARRSAVLAGIAPSELLTR